MNSEKWTLSYGVHRGTYTSRDAGMPKQFDTKELALNSFRNSRKFLHSIGYQIWYAKLTDPQGNTTTLEQNPYR
jgi:hypothetical protein